jgi:short-chain 2-methylacyl-CoA dehydrogenase
MGIKIAKKEQKLGIRASSTCTLNFDDLRIPAGNVIGSEGQGYKVPTIHCTYSNPVLHSNPDCHRDPQRRLVATYEFHMVVLIHMLGRVGIAAQMIGLAQGAFQLSVPYTYERKQVCRFTSVPNSSY